MAETIADLERRIEDPERYSASGKLTRGVLEKAKAVSPMKMEAREFNKAAEDFYREDLRKTHMLEGLQCLEEDLRWIAATACLEKQTLRDVMKSAAKDRSAADFVRDGQPEVLAETATPGLLRKLIALLIVTVAFDRRQGEQKSSVLGS